MNKTNDGGPAFPSWPAEYESRRGMSLRDYFAAKAMQGMLDSSVHSETFSDFHEGSAQAYAMKAYIMADAMLAAREAQ